MLFIFGKTNKQKTREHTKHQCRKTENYFTKIETESLYAIKAQVKE